MITITTKKLCLLFVENMLNCPFFFCWFLTHKAFHQGLCRVGRDEMRLTQPRGGLAVPLKEMKLLNAHASRCSERLLFSVFAKQKSYKEELFEVLRHLHFTKTIGAEISLTEVPLCFLLSLSCLFVCFDFSNEIHSLTKKTIKY